MKVMKAMNPMKVMKKVKVAMKAVKAMKRTGKQPEEPLEETPAVQAAPEAKETVSQEIVPATALKIMPRGSGMDPKEVSRMIGLLKYKSVKNDADGADAKQMMEDYYTMEPDEKKRFVEMFPDSKMIKAKGALGAWAGEYKKQIGFKKSAKAAINENFFTRHFVRRRPPLEGDLL